MDGMGTARQGQTAWYDIGRITRGAGSFELFLFAMELCVYLFLCFWNGMRMMLRMVDKN